jgi:hypothetical protein
MTAGTQRRWAAMLLTVVFSVTLAACSSGSHSVAAQAKAVQPTAAPQTTQSTSAPAAAPSTSALATTGSPSAPSTPTLSSSPGLETNIGDLQTATNTDPYDTQGVAEVNGVSYPDALGAQFCSGSNERKWTYVLERKYSALHGTIGLSDNSVSDAKIRFEILADGKLVFSKDLQIGQSVTLNVPVSNVLQMELDTILLTQDGGCGGATGEWADLQVVG